MVKKSNKKPINKVVQKDVLQTTRCSGKTVYDKSDNLKVLESIKKEKKVTEKDIFDFGGKKNQQVSFSLKKYCFFIMDRNFNYEQWQRQQMEENISYRKEHGPKSKSRTIQRSPSKEQIALLNISEIIFDNKLNIQENQYIELMNNLKTLAIFKKPILP